VTFTQIVSDIEHPFSERKVIKLHVNINHVASAYTVVEIASYINYKMKKTLFHLPDTKMYSAKLKITEDPTKFDMELYTRYTPPTSTDAVTSMENGDDFAQFYTVETNLEFSKILAAKLGFTSRRTFVVPSITSTVTSLVYYADTASNICAGNEYLFIHIPNLTGDTGEVNNGLSKSMASVCLRNGYAYKIDSGSFDKRPSTPMCKYRHTVEQPVYHSCAGGERIDRWTVTFQNANNHLINWLYNNLGDIHIKLHFRQRNLYY
jgi:hypothetical protein